MNHKTFIFSLLEVPLGNIDWYDTMYLASIMDGHRSAYAMHKLQKKIYEEKKLSNPADAEQFRPIAYININKRFRKLQRQGILEEEKIIGGSSHGAKNYRITERGLVFLIADGYDHLIIKYYKYFYQTKLFQTFILPYFENKTLNEPTIPFLKIIDYYLIDICIKINHGLNPNVLEEYSYDPKIPLSKQYDIEKADPNEDPTNNIFPLIILMTQLQTLHKSFILELALMDKNITDMRTICKNEDRLKTIEVLSKDKKYLSELTKIRSDIDHASKQLLSTRT